VAVAAADGHGGWFIGGSFVRVAGRARRFLAHVLPDGGLSAWDPGPMRQSGHVPLRGHPALADPSRNVMGLRDTTVQRSTYAPGG
jgi:hypothetical protein